MTRRVVFEEPDGTVAEVTNEDDGVLLLEVLESVATIVYEDEVVQIPIQRVYRGEVTGEDLNSVADQYHPDVIQRKLDRAEGTGAEQG